MASIQGVYVALFGRPADPTGLAFFNTATNNGGDLTKIGDLAATKEYKDRFDGQSNLQIVRSIYQSLFNRDPEPTGLNFFVDALNKGTLNINNIAIAILDGAQGDDKTKVDNKIKAADAFTKALDTPEEIAAYTGNAAAAAGRAFLQPVDKAASTVPNDAAVAKAVADIVTIGTGGVTLADVAVNATVSPTASDVKLKTSGGDDTINIVKVSGAASVLAADINGGFGTDTVALSVAGTAGGASPGGAGVAGTGGVAGAVTGTPVLTSVEKLTISAVAGNGGAAATGNAGNVGGDGGDATVTLDLSKSTSVKEVVITSTDGTKGADAAGPVLGGAAGDAAVALNDVALGTSIGFKGANSGNTTVTFKDAAGGTADSATLNFDAAKATGAVTVANIEAITISSTGSSSATALAVTAAKTVTITGSGDFVLGGAGSDFTAATKIDASAFAGKVTLNLNGSAGFAAADAVTVQGSSNADVINLSAGVDKLVYAKDEKSNYSLAESVTDFATGTDKVDLSAFAFAKTGVATLANVVDGADVFGTSSVAIWTGGGNTWVFADTNGDGKLNTLTDFAVQFTGAAAVAAADIILA